MQTEYPVKVSVAASMDAAMAMHPELREASKHGIAVLQAPTVSPAPQLDPAKLAARPSAPRAPRGPKV